MAKQLNQVNVNLAFTANTAQAKQEMQALQSQLNNIGKMAVSTDLPFTKSIQQASKAALELQQHLQNATNVSTGTLDFSKLSQSLKKSNTDLMSYARTLKNIGPEGQQAFMSLANAVSKAEIPIKRSNAHLQEMATTLKNTARWQLSSSVLHGFMGAIQGAYGYAQDLNESLNNIRIVTGQNVDQMAAFAKQANAAAQALSTTTTEYTNASLIYFQQGLNSKEVKERTDITIKLAQAAQQSVETTSDQLTAVWNNFYDGTQSLEHYADAMTKLGAVTASSVDEISGGLEKFASIGDMIGLSFDNAAAALATITATTRQSEDVVGTALKTIFARIQGLQLGETLEDGTTLNKYSEALDKVGISIYDSAGGLKDMDDILAEMGAKWDGLADTQQVALAQTVAGVRQYNQLVALMDNFDFYEENLATAQGSDGALTEAAEIYAESWEASRDRVKAAAQEVYGALIDEDFFIGLNDFFEISLNGVSALINSLGGLNGVLTALGATLTRVFSQQMAEGLRNMAYNIRMSTEAGRNNIKSEKINTMMAMGKELSYGVEGEGSAVGKAAEKQYRKQIELQIELETRKEKMSADEIAHAQKMMDLHRQVGEAAIQAQQRVEQSKDNLYDTKIAAREDIYRDAAQNDTADVDRDMAVENFKELDKELKVVETRYSTLKSLMAKGIPEFQLDNIMSDLDGIANACGVSSTEMARFASQLESAQIKVKSADAAMDAALADGDPQKIAAATQALEQAEQELEQIETQISDVVKASEALEKTRQRSGSIQGQMKTEGVSGSNAKKLAEEYRGLADAQDDAARKGERADKVHQKTNMTMAQAKGNVKDWANNITSAASAVMSFGMMLSSINGLMNTLNNPDISGFEKFITILSSSSMIIMGLIQTVNSLSQIKGKLTLATVKDTIATLANAAAESINAAATRTAAAAKDSKEDETREATAAVNENTAANIANAGSEAADAAASGQNAKSKGELGKAFKNLGGSIKNFVVANKGAIAGVAVAAVIITGAVMAYNKLEEAYNKDAIAAEEAAANAESLANNYSLAKSAYEDFISTLDGYTDARNSLDSLTEGTEEFKQAIFEANEQAMKLIDTVDGLEYTIDSNGLINIDQDSLIKAQQAQLEKAQKAQTASMVANQNAKNAQLKANQTEFNRKTAQANGWSSDDTNTTGKGASIGTGVGAGLGIAGGIGVAVATGAGLGSAVPVIGTLIGAAAGLIVGAIAGVATAIHDNNEQTKYEQQAMTAIADYYGKYGSAAFTEEGMRQALTEANLSVDEGYINSLLANEQATRDLIIATHENTVANQALNKQIVAQELSDNEIVQDSKYTDEVIGAVAANFDEDVEAQRKLLEDAEWGKDGISQAIAEDIFRQYAKAAGMDLDKVKLTDTTGTDSNRKFVYTDADGNEQTVALEDMMDTVATQRAAEAANKSAETLANIFNEFSDAQMNAVNAVLTDDAGSLSMGQLQNGFDVSTLNLTQQELEDLGYSTIEEFQAEMDATVAEAQKIWNNTLTRYSANTQELMNTIGQSSNQNIQNISTATVEAYGTMLDALQVVGGDEATDALSSGIMSLMEQNADKAQQIMQAASGIDWSQGESALNNFSNQLADMGIHIDRNSEAWKQFATSVGHINVSVVDRDLESIRTSIAEVKDIASDIEMGSIISDEDYETLVKYNSELRDMFALTADGYMYTGSGNVEDMANAIAIEQLKQAKSDNEKARNAHGALNNWGWRDGEGNFTSEDWYGLANGTDSDSAMNKMINALLENEAAHVEALGFDAETLQDLSNTLIDPNATEEQVNNARAILQSFYSEILTLNDNFEAEMYDDTKAEQVYASTLTTLNELNAAYQQELISQEVYADYQGVIAQKMLDNAESLSELEGARAIAESQGVEIDYDAYAENLIRLAEEYDNCTQEVLEYQAALASGDGEAIAAAEETLEASLMLAEAAEEYGFVAEELEVQAKELAKAYGLDEKAAVQLAVQNQRMNKGIVDLAENWEDWKKALKGTDKTTTDFAKAAVGATKAIADLVGASSDLELPSEFFNDENMALLEDAINGDIDAINKLGANVAIEQVKMLEFNQTMADMALKAWELDNKKIDPSLFGEGWETQFANDQATVLAGIEAIKSGVIGADQAMSADWVAALNRMALATGMSVEDMNGLLGSLGVQAKVTTTDVPQKMEVPTYIEKAEPTTYTAYESHTDSEGNVTEVPTTRVGWRKYTVPSEPVTVEGYATVAQISTEDNPLTAEIDTNFASSTTPSSGSAASYSGNRGSVAPSTTDAVNNAKEKSGGGGDTKAAENKDDLTKKDDIVERYKEVNDTLDDLADALSDASKEADRLWGQNRINAIKKQNSIIQQEISALEDKKKLAQQNLALDKQALDIAAQKAGVAFTYDEAGNITNYTEQLTNLYNELAAAEAHWANAANFANAEEQDAYENEVVQVLQDKIDELKELLGIYEETRELIEDLDNELDDKFYEWQDNNAEILSYELELKILINDNDLKRIESLLNQYDGEFFKMAESAALVGVESVNNATDALRDYESSYDDLKAAYEAGEISQAAFVEGLEECRDGLYEQIDALIDLDKQMKEFLQNTLDAASEEIASFTDHMEHFNGVFDHYLNLMEILGKQKDYDSMRDFMQGQADVTRDQLEVAKSRYEMMKKQKEELWVQLQDLDPTDENYDFLKAQWEAMVDATDEAQEEMLSLTETWAEQMKAIVQMNMEEIAETLENSLTNGLGFERLMDQYDKLNQRQEEYLTRTNQLYETDKLMRTANRALDETDNKVAKQKLKNFIAETQGLQEKNQLSEYELEIQQAKYDLLLAEIALEEAQNAKSTVRLSRDNEGNFGYVYTADEDKVADAEQNFYDKQNDLYNLSLEGQQQYTEKYLQAQQEMYNQLKELQQMYLDGEIATEEEFKARQAEIINHYYGEGGVLWTYSELYRIACIADSNAVEDNWQKDYGDMTQHTSDWQEAVDGYLKDIEAETETWAEVSQQANEDVENALNDSATATENLTNESEELRDFLEDKLIPAIDDEIDAVEAQTQAYYNQRQEIMDLIDEYRNLIAEMDAYQQAAASAGQNSDGSWDVSGISDYSAAMADYLKGGGNTSDEYYQALLSARADKMTQAEYQKYQASSPAFNKLMQMYDAGDPEAVAYVNSARANGEYWDVDKINDIVGMLSGGYTGAWGPEGKLAVLHEKELVLNPEDTSNLLKTVSFIRELVGMIDSQASMSSLFNLTAASGMNMMDQSLEQHVEIHAEFPAATDRYEIEEAFNNLVNRASQFANRKR